MGFYKLEYDRETERQEKTKAEQEEKKKKAQSVKLLEQKFRAQMKAYQQRRKNRGLM